jgi:hypothetical protein
VPITLSFGLLSSCAQNAILRYAINPSDELAGFDRQIKAKFGCSARYLMRCSIHVPHVTQGNRDNLSEKTKRRIPLQHCKSFGHGGVFIDSRDWIPDGSD